MLRVLILITMCFSIVACQSTPFIPIPSQSTSIPRLFKLNQNTQPIFPTKKGFNWNYQVKLSSVDDQYTIREGSLYLTTEKVEKIGSNTKLQLRMIDSYSNRYRFPTILMSPEAIHINDVTFIGVGGYNAPGFSTHFLPLPLKVNQRADDGQWISKVKGQETIRVPDGTHNTWKIEVIGTKDQDYTVVGNYWISPGVGIIKSDVTIPGWYVETVLESAYLNTTPRK